MRLEPGQTAEAYGMQASMEEEPREDFPRDRSGAWLGLALMCVSAAGVFGGIWRLLL